MRPPLDVGSARSRSTASWHRLLVRVVLCCHTHRFVVAAISVHPVDGPDLRQRRHRGDGRDLGARPLAARPLRPAASRRAGVSARRRLRASCSIGMCAALVVLSTDVRHERGARISVARAARRLPPGGGARGAALPRLSRSRNSFAGTAAFALFFVALVFAGAARRQRRGRRGSASRTSSSAASSSASRTSATAASGFRSACISPGT